MRSLAKCFRPLADWAAAPVDTPASSSAIGLSGKVMDRSNAVGLPMVGQNVSMHPCSTCFVLNAGRSPLVSILWETKLELGPG